MSFTSSVAILTLLEDVLQHLFSFILCFQQGRGSKLVSLILQKLLWKHNVTFLSRSSFNISSLFLLPSQSLTLDVLFTAVSTAFRCVTKARFKASDPMSIWYELYTLMCFDICFLAYSYHHAIMFALNHDICRLQVHTFFTSIGMFKTFHIVSKRGPYFLHFHRNVQDFPHCLKKV